MTIYHKHLYKSVEKHLLIFSNFLGKNYILICKIYNFNKVNHNLYTHDFSAIFFLASPFLLSCLYTTSYSIYQITHVNYSVGVILYFFIYMNSYMCVNIYTYIYIHTDTYLGFLTFFKNWITLHILFCVLFFCSLNNNILCKSLLV